MSTSRIRPRLATAVAVAAIGVVSLGLTGAGNADAAKPKPPAPTPSDQPVATMTIHPDGAEPFSTAVYSLQDGIGVGVSSPAGGTREASKPSVSEMVVTRKTDSTSPVLFRYITRGTILPEVDLSGTLPDGTAFEYELTDVILSGFSSSAGGTSFNESLSLNFTKIVTTVGANSAGYDLVTDKAS